jgi:hypothetical protein
VLFGCGLWAVWLWVASSWDRLPDASFISG